MNTTRAFVTDSCPQTPCLNHGGIRYLVTNIPSSESCAISLMIRLGSVYESKSLEGASHLIEHMVFKGTKNLPDSLSISKLFDSMGAQYNAYTDYNMTSYHLKVQTKYVEPSLQLLTDMVSNSLFRERDIISEKKVVIEELRRERDDPASYVHELQGTIVFQGNKLGIPIGGSEQSVMDIKPKELVKYWKDNYHPDNIVVSIAGNITPSEVESMITRSHLMSLPISDQPRNQFTEKIPLQRSPRVKVNHRDNMSQVQIVMGFPTRFNQNHPDRYPAYVARTILAGPMSSRLFIAMRDTYGLSYSVSCNVSLFETGGEFSVFTGADPSGLMSGRAIPPTADSGKDRSDPYYVICQEIFRMARDKASDEEVNKAKEFIKGNLLLEMENNQNITEFYGKQFLLEKYPVVTVGRYLDDLDRVTANDVQRVCRDMFQPEMMNVSSIGDVKESELKKYIKSQMHHWINYLA